MAKVLVADDEPLCREFISRALLGLGHQIAITTSGEEAIDLVRERPPDLLIVDIRLDGVDGIAVAKAIEAIQPDLPVIVTTGYVLPTEALSLFQRDAVRYLPKPFRLQTLMKSVEEALTFVERRGQRPTRAPYPRAVTRVMDHGQTLGFASQGDFSGYAPAGLLTVETAFERAATAVIANDEGTRFQNLLAVLEACAESGPMKSPDGSERERRQRIVQNLVAAIVRCITVESLLVCGVGLRNVRRGRPSPLRRACEQLADRLRQAINPRRQLDRRVAAALGELQARGRNCGRLKETQIASDLAVDPAHLGHLIRNDTGFSFVEWSWGVRMILAVAALAKGTESIKEVAYNSGFGNTAQFDRCFRRLFDLSPTAFRAMAIPPRPARTSVQN